MSKINYKNTLALRYASSIFTYITSQNLQNILDFQLVHTSDVFLQNENLKNVPLIQLVTDELRFLTFSILKEKKFIEFLKDPTYSSLKKIELVYSVFPNLSNLTKAFLKVLGEKNHLYLLPEILVEYSRILNDFSGVKSFYMIVSFIPKESQLEIIQKYLSNKNLLKIKLNVIDLTSFQMNQIALKVIHDSSILAGFILYEGSRKLVDLSLRSKLQKIVQSI